jgi:hypothetical protein
MDELERAMKRLIVALLLCGLGFVVWSVRPSQLSARLRAGRG